MKKKIDDIKVKYDAEIEKMAKLVEKKKSISRQEIIKLLDTTTRTDDEIKAYVEKQLEKVGYKVDMVFSHTCPYKYEPREVFLKTIDQSNVDKSTELWLDEIENELDYKKWYCGHFHTEKKIDKMQFMFEEVKELKID